MIVGIVAGVQANPSFTNCQVSGNHATGDDASGGGGVAVVNGAKPRFKAVNVKGNTATLSGGGVLVSGSGSDPTFQQCNISSNSAITGFDATSVGGGGGLQVKNSAKPRFYECDFRYNTAANSGGVLVKTTGSVALFQACTFDRNDAEVRIIQGHAHVTY